MPGRRRSPDILAGADSGRFELLTTARAMGAAPVELAEEATAVHQVQPGPVHDVAAALIDAGAATATWSRSAAAA